MKQVLIHDPQNRHWMQFTRPRAILQAGTLSDVMPLLTEVQQLVGRDGLYAAGWIGYEAAPAFDSALRTRSATAFPFACFGIFGPPAILTALPAAGHLSGNPTWHPSVSRAEYGAAIARIKNHIAAGDTYQVNYTLRQWSDFREDPWAFFLKTCADARYGAFVDAGPYSICSASPELFFSLQGKRIFSKPMKGTAGRGRNSAEDRENGRWLYHSEKNRAENVMIVDMVRNDLGRVARYGSVKVPRLFDIEKYPTVLQMTSTVEARTAASLPEILKALFPCASITGAPKAKTMEIIAAVETTPRNIYTGTIGCYGPGRRAMFNVAIRTTLIDKETSRAEYGVGGGIVWDSTTEEEYEECLTKARIILDPASPTPFDLLETLLWTPEEGFFLMSRHLDRLRDSALYFDYPYDLLSRDGAVECQAAPLEPPTGRPLRVRLAKEAVPSRDPFLFHKTTRRERYEKARTSYPDSDDVLLYNEKGEVTESCIANVVILRNDRWVTPPVRCGLLNGTYRTELLENGEISEETVSLSELKKAEKIFLINSVRKWREALLPAEDRIIPKDNR
ncbi:MAG: aminodeoxychorismate synthase component I [Deltaproteobacteria bacterium]|nr:aminodeoxychorismate synthase component I [Deltaproteobacteria bacterium]